MKHFIVVFTLMTVGNVILSLATAVFGWRRSRRQYASERATAARAGVDRANSAVAANPLALSSPAEEKVLSALSGIDLAAVRVGPLLLITLDDVVRAFTLSEPQQTEIEARPDLLQSPELLLRWAESSTGADTAKVEPTSRLRRDR